MKIAVRYNAFNEETPRTLIVDISDNTRNDEDSFWGAASDELEKMGISVKWHTVEGIVEINELKLFLLNNEPLNK